MGARNVSVAFTRWGHLPHAQFKLLVGMALQALDTGSDEGRPPRVYFGGEEGLIAILGRSRSTTYEVLAALKAAGAIEVLESGRQSHRAVYRLALDPFTKGPDVPDATAEAQRPGLPDATGSVSSGRKASGSSGRTGSGSSGPLGTTQGATGKSRPGQTSSPSATTEGATTVGAKTDSPLDYDTAYQIVQAALGIEAASARIVELTVAGTDYETAMATLAQEVQSGKAGKR